MVWGFSFPMPTSSWIALHVKRKGCSLLQRKSSSCIFGGTLFKTKRATTILFEIIFKYTSLNCKYALLNWNQDVQHETRPCNWTSGGLRPFLKNSVLCDIIEFALQIVRQKYLPNHTIVDQRDTCMKGTTYSITAKWKKPINMSF